MTFGARSFQGMSQGSVIPFGPAVSNNSAALGVRSGTMSLASDGSGTQTQLGTSHAIQWYAPVTTGIGSSVWCKLTINSTNFTNMTGTSTGTIQTVGGCAWTFTSSASNQEGTGTFTLTFYGDAAGTNLLSTQTGSWDVGYTP